VRFIVLRVRDTKSYLSKAGVVGRINGYLSLILYGGPIFLSTAGLAADMDIDELATKLNEFRNRYGDT
jgi:hypothetical protein